QRHTMGLRPFGLYLSGGLDSTIILHELAKESKDLINTYTTRFETKQKELNEDADAAKRLTNDYKINHHELIVTEKDFINATEKTIETLEEPRYNFSVPAYWLLAQHASRDITVILNGSGGDELFLGYDRYLESLKLSHRYQKHISPLFDLWHTAAAIRKKHTNLGQSPHLNRSYDRWAYLNRIVPLLSSDIYKLANHFGYVKVAKYIESLKYPDMQNLMPDPENTIAYMDRKLWLADEEFIRTDKIAMNFGMEGRFPFLARDVVEYAEGIESSEKLKGGATKALVRGAYRGHLPDYIIDKSKTGWYAPVVEWMNSDYGKMVREVLSDDYYKETAELFDLNNLRKKHIDDVSHFTRGNIKRFMSIMNFQIWARAFKIQL
ncbi:MAG: asparagine synthase C-terminal domain-containing protein, partial [Parcubacteria group bacterium]